MYSILHIISCMARRCRSPIPPKRNNYDDDGCLGDIFIEGDHPDRPLTQDELFGKLVAGDYISKDEFLRRSKIN